MSSVSRRVLWRQRSCCPVILPRWSWHAHGGNAAEESLRKPIAESDGWWKAGSCDRSAYARLPTEWSARSHAEARGHFRARNVQPVASGRRAKPASTADSTVYRNAARLLPPVRECRPAARVEAGPEGSYHLNDNRGQPERGRRQRDPRDPDAMPRRF